MQYPMQQGYPIQQYPMQGYPMPEKSNAALFIVLGILVVAVILIIWQWDAIKKIFNPTIDINLPAGGSGSGSSGSGSSGSGSGSSGSGSSGSGSGSSGSGSGSGSGSSGQKPAPKYPTQWSCVNDVDVPIRRENNSDHDISCMSENGRDCVWGNCTAKLAEYANKPQVINPLVCGPMHNSLYGETGYTNNIHWCYKGNNLIPKV